MSAEVSLLVTDEEIKALFRDFSKIINQDLNRGLEGGVKSLATRMAREKHGPGRAFHVRRRGATTKVRPPGVNINKKARLAGWVAYINGRSDLNKKKVTFRTGNLLLKNLEYGAEIKARNRARLGQRNRFRQVGKVRTGALKVGIRNRKGDVILFRTVRKVRIPAKLGARRLMNSHEAEWHKRLIKALNNALKRANRVRAKRGDKKTVYSLQGSTVRRTQVAA